MAPRAPFSGVLTRSNVACMNTAPYGYPDIPTLAYRKDKLTWARALPAFPFAGGWALKYDFVSLTGRVSLRDNTDSVQIDDAGNGNWTVLVPSTTTAWAAGKYTWTEWVEKTGERQTLSSGRTEILLNFDDALAASGYDSRSGVRKVYDALQALLEGKALRGDQLAYTIAGRSLQRLSFDEVTRAHEKYRQLVIAEDRREAAARGVAVGGVYKVRFAG